MRISIALALLVGLTSVAGAKDTDTPQLYALDTRSGDIFAGSLYDGAPERVATLPGTPAFLGAELATTVESGKLIVLAPERGELILADLTVSPAKFQTQALSPGSRALRPDASGKRFAYFDRGANELRLMAATFSNGTITDITGRAPLAEEAVPAVTAIHPTGQRALVTLPFEGSITMVDEDGEGSTFPSPIGFPVLASFGAADTDEIYLIGQKARVVRIGGDGDVLAASQPVPFSTHLIYAGEIDRVILIELIKPGTPLSQLHLLDGQTLEPTDDDVQLPALDGAILNAAVHDRDLVLLRRGDGTTRLTIVDLVAGDVIEDTKIETPFATGLAIR